MNNIIYIGIDPGLAGGLAFLDFDCLGNLQSVSTTITPTIKNPKKKTGKLYNLRELSLLFQTWSTRPCFATLERSHPMPGQGVTSTYSIGFGAGVYQTLLEVYKIPHQVISAQTWQKVLLKDINKKNTKEASIVIAQRLFPKVNLVPLGCKKPSDGISDALLLAEYGHRVHH